MHTAEILTKQCDAHRGDWVSSVMHTAEMDLAAWCSPQSFLKIWISWPNKKTRKNTLACCQGPRSIWIIEKIEVNNLATHSIKKKNLFPRIKCFFLVWKFYVGYLKIKRVKLLTSKLMRIVFFIREWYYLRHFLTPRLLANVQIDRYMKSAKDDSRCFVHGLKTTI